MSYDYYLVFWGMSIFFLCSSGLLQLGERGDDCVGMGGVGQTVVPSLADVPHGAASCCLGGLDVLVVAVSDDDRLRWFYPEGFDS